MTRNGIYIELPLSTKIPCTRSPVRPQHSWRKCEVEVNSSRMRALERANPCTAQQMLEALARAVIQMHLTLPYQRKLAVPDADARHMDARPLWTKRSSRIVFGAGSMAMWARYSGGVLWGCLMCLLPSMSYLHTCMYIYMYICRISGAWSK